MRPARGVLAVLGFLVPGCAGPHLYVEEREVWIHHAPAEDRIDLLVIYSGVTAGGWRIGPSLRFTEDVVTGRKGLPRPLLVPMESPMAFFSPKWRLSGELSGEPPCAYLDEEERLCWYQRASFDNVSAVLAHWNDDLRETILELPPPDPPVEPDDAEAAFLRDWHPILRTWAESGRDFIRLAGSQLVFEVPIPEDRLPQSLQDLEEELRMRCLRLKPSFSSTPTPSEISNRSSWSVTWL